MAVHDVAVHDGAIIKVHADASATSASGSSLILNVSVNLKKEYTQKYRAPVVMNPIVDEAIIDVDCEAIVRVRVCDGVVANLKRVRLPNFNATVLNSCNDN